MAAIDVRNAVNLANANAAGFVTLANAQLASAQTAIAAVGFTVPTWTPVVAPASPTTGAIPKAPVLVPVQLTLPSDPGTPPELVAPDDIDTSDKPSFTLVPPVFTLPSQPSALAAAPDAPEIDTNFDFPEPPAELSKEIPAPEIKDAVMPAKPSIEPVVFEGDVPEAVEAPPEDLAGLFAGKFKEQSAEMRDLAEQFTGEWMKKTAPGYEKRIEKWEEKIAELLEPESKRLSQNHLALGLYERAKTASDGESRRLQSAAFSDFAARGFTMPGGALMSAVRQARQAGADNNAQAGREIMIARMETERKNVEFVFSAIRTMHDKLIDASSAYLQSTVTMFNQATTYAKSVFDSSVEIYNTKVRYFSAQMERYKGEVDIYKSKIEAGQAKIDIYKAEISAEAAKSQVDSQRVAVYRAQIDAVSSLIGVYKARVEAVLGQVSLEKTKLEIFQAETQSYGAKVQAKNAEWSGFNAKLSGEESKVKIFTAQANAYDVQVNAYKTKIEAGVAKTNADIAKNRSVADMYNSQIEAYKARVSAESAKSQAQNDNNRSALSAFQGELASFDATTRLELAKYNVQAEATLKNSTGDLESQIAGAKAKSEYGQALAQLSSSGASIYGQLASSAMAGMNTLASISATSEE